ncbi:hypothetical protein B0H19DRAFT_1258772 [Mycena capillaripes]|nr:hypothetical protein B0H19DRAFT_1258772 [Mycena capillaripes]
MNAVATKSQKRQSLIAEFATKAKKGIDGQIKGGLGGGIVCVTPHPHQPMPATRRPRLTPKPKAGSYPLPRITDPYAPRDEDDPPPETALEKRQEEKEWAAVNR